jgi:hypothetical protein
VIARARGEGKRGRESEGEKNRGFFTAEMKICFFKCPTARVENTSNN